MDARYEGTVKWFDSSKGYGFITMKNASGMEDTEDVFVHQTSIKASGFRSLAERADVEFSIEVDQRNRKKAINVTAPGGKEIVSERPNFYGRNAGGGGGGGSNGGSYRAGYNDNAGYGAGRSYGGGYDRNGGSGGNYYGGNGGGGRSYNNGGNARGFAGNGGGYGKNEGFSSGGRNGSSNGGYYDGGYPRGAQY